MNSNGSIVKTVNGVDYLVGVNDERYPRLLNELNSYMGNQGNQALRTVVGDTIYKGQVNWTADGKPVTITQGDRLVATLNYNSKSGTYATDNSSIVTKMNNGSLVIQKNSNNVSDKPNSTADKSTVNSAGAVWPVEYFKNMNVSSKYGWRTDPVSGESKFHTGIDIAGQGVRGQDIYASYGGVVKEVKSSGAYGQHVIIESTINGTTVCILYAHMIQGSPTEQGIKNGDIVEAGQIIGNVGNTGRVTGNHLHFEVRVKRHTSEPDAIFILEI
jgi:murein DD-endopeptidase MepM/ murein hydrolase activator NlpD